MKKIHKQLLKRYILPIALMLVGIAVIIIMIAIQPEEGGQDSTVINILGIVGFLIPWIFAIFFLIKFAGKSMVVSMLSRELKELKRHKDYYFGSIITDDAKKYLDTITADLTNAGFKNLSQEVNLPHENYGFFLRKHFWTLDSTNIHVHTATVKSDINKIKEFFDGVTNKEITLNYGKFKGSYCGIVAICAVDEFKEDEHFFDFFDDVMFVRQIAVVKVLIDVAQNRIYISRGGMLTGNRGQRIVKRFVLKTKSLKKCPGYFGKNNEVIAELEEKLNNLDFKDLFGKAELSEQQNTYANSLNNGEVGFLKEETAEDGGMIFYKENEKILYLFCDYDDNEKTFGILGIRDMKWNIPKKSRIPKNQKEEITKKIIKHLDEKNIPYAFVEMFFSQKNQTVLMNRNKNE